MVHYPSDILGGICAGAIGAGIAFYLTGKLYAFHNKFQAKNLERRRNV